jgi:hypothetical protein
MALAGIEPVPPQWEASDFYLRYGTAIIWADRLYGLVVRVSGYRSRGPRFDSWPYQIFWEVGGLEGVHSASRGQLRSYMNEKVVAVV